MLICGVPHQSRTNIDGRVFTRQEPGQDQRIHRWMGCAIQVALKEERRWRAAIRERTWNDC